MRIVRLLLTYIPPPTSMDREALGQVRSFESEVNGLYTAVCFTP